MRRHLWKAIGLGAIFVVALAPSPRASAQSVPTAGVDTDGDGLEDAVEILLGTDPSKKDSDDDGISDLIEVTPIGGGAPAKVDTDGDGIIDALDTDSDNDGIL